MGIRDDSVRRARWVLLRFERDLENPMVSKVGNDREMNDWKSSHDRALEDGKISGLSRLIWAGCRIVHDRGNEPVLDISANYRRG